MAGQDGAVASRSANGGGLRRFGVSVGPQGRLPCGARVQGPAAELASRPSGATLKQLPRACGRSALRARASHPALLGDPQARHSPPPSAETNTRHVAKGPSAAHDTGALPPFAAAAGACLGCHWERREAQGRGRRAQRASKTDSPQLSERSALGARSEFCGATLPRASQRSRPSGRPLPPAPRAGPRCSGAHETGADSNTTEHLTSAANRSPAGPCPGSAQCRPGPAPPHACSHRSAS